MKSLSYVLLLMSLGAHAKVDLPIFGEYQLHQQLEGGCMGLSKKDTLFISYSEFGQEYSIVGKGKKFEPFRNQYSYYDLHFLSSYELGVHKSEPTQRGFVYVTTFGPFNEGRGLHAAEVLILPDTNYRNVIVDATFEVDGEFLFANFRNTRLMNNEGAGKCILKRVQSN